MVKRGVEGGQLRPLSDDEVRDIHMAALEVLSQVGMECSSSRIIEIFKKAGADVDEEAKRIRIPEYLIEDALRKAPSEIILCGRNPENDILLEGNRIYFGMGGTPTPYYLDVNTGDFRRPTKKDMEDVTRLGDALGNMSFLMTLAGAFDVPYEVEYLHEFDALFSNTAKPIVYSTPGADATKHVLEMASAIAGGPEELRKRPIFCLYAETASPLMFQQANENMIDCAKAGVPITLGPMPLAGGTGPITTTGTNVIGLSENLAAITLVQLVKPGAPIILAAWAGLMDPRTGRCAYGSPEFALGVNLVNAQLARLYDLPTFGFGGPSDSAVPDAQAGSEVTMNLMVSSLSGVNLIHDCGYLSGGSIGSPEMAVICNEIAGMVSRIVKGVSTEDEWLAVDVIKKVGPGGHFMAEPHTLKHLKETVFLPELFDRRPEMIWKADGAKTLRQRANAKVKEILKTHQPEPLSDDVKAKIKEIIRKAEKELVKS